MLKALIYNNKVSGDRISKQRITAMLSCCNTREHSEVNSPCSAFCPGDLRKSTAEQEAAGGEILRSTGCLEAGEPVFLCAGTQGQGPMSNCW